jgi:two-component system chemotaxis response regulator CheB
MAQPLVTTESRVRTLVVDDSAFMRRVISDLLAHDPAIEVVGYARDGIDALAKIAVLKPDVVTLDIQMPRLDGLATLTRIMSECPLPVVMVSSLTQEAAEETVEALSRGAVDVVAKPSGPISFDMVKMRDELIAKVKTASRARPGAGRRRRSAQARSSLARQQAYRAPVTAAMRGVIFIASSTGGPAALAQVLEDLPQGLPAAVVVVQHMPPGFTASLAGRLDQACALRVKEAAPGDQLTAGRVFLAEGGRHLAVGPDLVLLSVDGPTRHGVRPSADVTLETLVPAVREHGYGLAGAVLTGMGMDGARGMALLRKAGGWVIAQDEASSVVYGMPRAVVEMGLADEVLSLEDIGGALARAIVAEKNGGR